MLVTSHPYFTLPYFIFMDLPVNLGSTITQNCHQHGLYYSLYFSRGDRYCLSDGMLLSKISASEGKQYQ